MVSVPCVMTMPPQSGRPPSSRTAAAIRSQSAGSSAELSTAIILYSVTTETLTLTVYTSVVQGNDGVAAAVATILLVVTTISLLLFMKFSKNKDIAF